MTFGSSGTGTGMYNSIPEVREREGNGKNPFPKFGNGKGMKKKAFPKFGNRKGMKKSIPIIREWESEAFILGNGREREFPLTPASFQSLHGPLKSNLIQWQWGKDEQENIYSLKR